jgi:hypothetical protein
VIFIHGNFGKSISGFGGVLSQSENFSKFENITFQDQNPNIPVIIES